MYKLGYICAMNFIAYMAGLGIKKFELDFTKMLDKTIIAILGDNGLGKSALGSMIHPSYLPISHNKKYVLRGKEGRLIRHYYGPDGKVLELQTVSMPKNSDDDDAWTHSNKAFFAIRDGETLTELNPSGNIESYNILVYQYFGITQSIMSMLIYNKKMEGFVAMSSADRISRVSDLIPNTAELADRYKIGSEGFRRVKNEMKNIDQKLGRLKDASVLKSELSSLEDSINRFVDKRETLIEELAVCRSDRDRLASSEDVSISKKFKEMSYEHDELLYEYKQIESALRRYDMTKSISDVSMEQIRLEGERNLLTQSYMSVSDKISELEREIEELLGDIKSQETEDVDSLIDDVEHIKKRMDSLSYSKYVGKFDNLNYQAAQMLHNALELINDQYSVLVDHHGDIVSQYFGNRGAFVESKDPRYLMRVIDDADKECMELTTAYNKLESRIRELDAKSYMRDVLDKRPDGCKIDSCSFITDALEWPAIESDLIQLKDQSDVVKRKLEGRQEYMSNLKQLMTFLYSVTTFESLLESNADGIKTYLGVDLKEIKKAFASGIPHKIFCLIEIRDIMAILSEKSLYENMNEQVKSLSSLIEKIKVTSGAYNKIKEKITKLESKADSLYKERAVIKDKRDAINDILDKIIDEITELSSRDELIQRRDKIAITLESFSKELSLMKEKLTILEEIDSQISSKREALSDIDNRIAPLVRQRDVVKYELNQRHTLELERDELTETFLIMELVTEITKPGKGMWKALFNFYMEDVREVANMLLSQTFDCNLQLEKFDIKTDKFTIPYSFQGVLGDDASEASGAQRAAISICMAIGMIENVISKYGILVFDEADKDMSPKRKEEFINIILNRLGYIGISQTFAITHSPENYMREEVGYVLFPGHTLDMDMVKKREYILVA